jgi:hypothetical protein
MRNWVALPKSIAPPTSASMTGRHRAKIMAVLPAVSAFRRLRTGKMAAPVTLYFVATLFAATLTPPSH